MNSSFVVINIDNSSDNEPVIKKNHLLTRKQNTQKHGLGIISIEHALKNYKGRIKWSYNHETNVFTTIILMHFQPNTL